VNAAGAQPPGPRPYAGAGREADCAFDGAAAAGEFTTGVAADAGVRLDDVPVEPELVELDDEEPEAASGPQHDSELTQGVVPSSL
jgi:hypothetical protein